VGGPNCREASPPLWRGAARQPRCPPGYREAFGDTMAALLPTLHASPIVIPMPCLRPGERLCVLSSKRVRPWLALYRRCTRLSTSFWSFTGTEPWDVTVGGTETTSWNYAVRRLVLRFLNTVADAQGTRRVVHMQRKSATVVPKTGTQCFVLQIRLRASGAPIVDTDQPRPSPPRRRGSRNP
jgi:hypothetical protein